MSPLVPNSLTVFRMIAAPIIPLLVHRGTSTDYLIAFILFVLGSISDSLDGLFARKYNISTRFGRILDPIADKALVICALVALWDLGMVKWYISALILFRDLFITVLRLFQRKKQNVISPTGFAKFKTLYLMVLISVLLFFPYAWFIPADKLVSFPNILMAIAAILSWITALPYITATFSKNK